MSPNNNTDYQKEPDSMDKNDESHTLARNAVKAVFASITGSMPEELYDKDGQAIGFSPGKVVDDDMYTACVMMGQIQEEILLHSLKFLTLLHSVQPNEDTVGLFKFMSRNMVDMFQEAATCMDDETVYKYPNIKCSVEVQNSPDTASPPVH